MSDRTKRARILCAIGSLTSAVVIAGGVFGGLPARWMPVDATAVIATLACVTSGALWIVDSRHAERVGRIVSVALLLIGLVLVVVLAATASYLSGIYGPVGKGGAMLLVFIAALVVPYGIALPAAQLLYLGRKK